MRLVGQREIVAIISILIVCFLSFSLIPVFAQENNQTGQHYKVNIADEVTDIEPIFKTNFQTDENKQLEFLQDLVTDSQKELGKSTDLIKSLRSDLATATYYNTVLGIVAAAGIVGLIGTIVGIKLSRKSIVRAESSHPVTIKDPKTGEVLKENVSLSEQNSKPDTKKFDWL